jgi:drug/metabolite transporter (DMT)-like permease
LISLNISIPFSGQVFATLAILIIAAIIVAWVMKKLNNPFLAIAVTWAFYGVYVKRIVDVSSIAYTALAMGALVVLSIFIFSIRPVAKKNIFLKRSVSFVVVLLPGERNGKKIGKTFAIAVIAAE